MPPRKTKQSTSKVTETNKAVKVVEPKAKVVKTKVVKEPKAKVVKVKTAKEPKAKVVKVKVVKEPVVDGEPVARKKRSVPTLETVDEQFNELLELILAEIEKRREASSNKINGIKFLRTVNKRLKTLHARSLRVMKKKKVRPRSTNTNSGFLKAVNISAEMAKFTGWAPEETRSRVEVTKFLCNYIKEHDLQNPVDRRQILPDDKLATLLGYDAATAEKPLYYYSMQTYLKPHFTKIE